MGDYDDRLDKAADQWGRRPWWTTLKWILGLGAIALICVVIVSLISTGSLFFQAEVAKRTLAPRVTQRVYGTDNAINNVAFFHDKCQAVLRDVQVYRNNAARLRADQRAAQTETDPLKQQQAQAALTTEQSQVTAAQNTAASDAADYNSASAQYTRNPFKDANLPYRIELPADPVALAEFTINCG